MIQKVIVRLSKIDLSLFLAFRDRVKPHHLLQVLRYQVCITHRQGLMPQNTLAHDDAPPVLHKVACKRAPQNLGEQRS